MMIILTLLPYYYLQLKSVLDGRLDFNCTEDDVNNVIAHVEIFQTLNESFFLLDSCFDCVPDLSGWVRRKIPCDRDGRLVREYLTSLPALGLQGRYNVDC